MRLEAVILPELGTGPDVAIIISHWFAARGDEVWEGERLVEIRVGPATLDVAAPATGRLTEIREHEDDQVRPGAVLGRVAVRDDDRTNGDLDGDNGHGRDNDRRPGPPPSSHRSS